MATKTNNKNTTKASTRNTKADAPAAVDLQEHTAPQNKPLVAKDIDPHQYITVRNGFQGKLVYISPKTKERFVWDGFGAEQEMELLELRNAKNSAKKFFENNWFMFDDDWVVAYLGLNQYYKHAVRIEDFDKIFELTPAEIQQTVGSMSQGQQKSVAYRAKQLIADGEIDSNKAINALEKALGIELIER